MPKLSDIANISDDQLLLEKLFSIKDEIGMLEFNQKDEILEISNEYFKIGNFELDIIAIDKSNGNVVMLDHDSPDFVMGKCAKSIGTYLRAIQHFSDFIEDDNSIFDDEEITSLIAKNASAEAGGEEYLWFYRMMFGI